MTFDLELPSPPTETRTGPQVCCADFAIVTDCDGERDYWKCFLCDRRWSAICRPDDAEGCDWKRADATLAGEAEA